jgi:uncharacterized iron-regulated membrane protein
VRRTLIVLAMTGIYVWIRRQQREILSPTVRPEQAAEAEWKNESGAAPSPTL